MASKRSTAKLGLVSKHWLLPKEEGYALVDMRGTATPPSKDFYQIFLRPDIINDQGKLEPGCLILRVWKIVPPTRPEKKSPAEYKDTFLEYIDDDKIQSEIQRCAGKHTADYITEMVENGRIDYLDRLDKNIIFQIILHLDLEDIYRLGRVSKKFREYCNSCDLWEMIYRKYSQTPITQDLLMLAAERGWKKLFFTNKLQLQMQLLRIRKHEGSTAFMTQEEEGQ
ncbi:hypothetical protein KUTeg_011616 [Tegillarca granosa]|uniref:F-box domain-containing protein n=1 Tax=Tegillarca granosa TaxID=220873 RepID=A0ABQ9EZL5_TEGGR|nr:hypothetical protein KUTeg_011616 [Tegillarca granosa]